MKAGQKQFILPVIFLPEMAGKKVFEVRRVVGAAKSYKPFVMGEPVGEDHEFDGHNLDFKKM